MITEKTTLTELERLCREYHVQSISLERPPNDRSGVAARLERRDRVVVVRTGATVADAIGLALAHLISLPMRIEAGSAPLYVQAAECSCGVARAINGRCVACGGTVSG